jgi:hypothetical protein
MNLKSSQEATVNLPQVRVSDEKKLEQKVATFLKPLWKDKIKFVELYSLIMAKVCGLIVCTFTHDCL